jgi:hypothetical protein
VVVRKKFLSGKNIFGEKYGTVVMSGKNIFWEKYGTVVIFDPM